MVEEWRAIAGYEGSYEISSLGRVKSHWRKKENILAYNVSKDGYLHVLLWKNNKMKKFRVNRLVAFAFISTIEGKIYVNHIDGIKSNNQVSNLEWCTASENELHKCRVIYKYPIRRQNRIGKRVAQFSMNNEKIAEYASTKEAWRITNTDYSAISKVCLGKNKYANGFIWKYI